MPFLFSQGVLACAIIGGAILDSCQALHLGDSRRSSSGKAVSIPIEVDHSDRYIKGVWTVNFTVGANRSQRLILEPGQTEIWLNKNSYDPSRESKDLHDSFTTPVTILHDLNATTNVTSQHYRDVVGVAGISTEVPVLVATKIDSTSNVAQRFATYGNAPLGYAQDSWLGKVCAQKQLSQCRYGLAMGTNGKGMLNLGKIDDSAIEGEVVTRKLSRNSELIVYGDVVLDGKVQSSQNKLHFTSDGNKIYGSVSEVRKINKNLGITEIPSSDDKVVRGSFPCDKPPKFGFRLANKNFYVQPSAMVYKHGDNNTCISVVEGNDKFPSSFLDTKAWLVGISFFEGHYVDFNFDNNMLSIATLKGYKEGEPEHHKNSSNKFTASWMGLLFVALISIGFF